MCPGLIWALCLLYYCQYHNNQSYFVIHFLQMRKLKYRQIQQLVQNLIASKLGNWDLNPCRLTPSSMPLTPWFYGHLISSLLYVHKLVWCLAHGRSLKVFFLMDVDSLGFYHFFSVLIFFPLILLKYSYFPVDIPLLSWWPISISWKEHYKHR